MLSVITLVRNRNRMLNDFLRAWSAQTFDDLEIVVVRAGGAQDPADASASHPLLDVVHVDLPRCLDSATIAYSHARNAGAAAASGDLIVFCDADTMPAGDFADNIHSGLAQVDALLAGDVRYLPADADLRLPIDSLSRLARPHPRRPRPPDQPGRVDLSLPHGLVWGLCMAVRASTFAEIGGFDESYLGYAGEDTDLGRAMKASGRPAGHVGGATILHQHHDSFEPPLHQMAATVLNAQRYRDKWGDWPMQGWLAQFERLGLIFWGADSIDVLRSPTDAEIEAHRCCVAAPFRSAIAE